MNNNVGIIIDYAHSYEYDLENQTYTVFYIGKPTQKVKFRLTEKERNEIISKYYNLNLDKLKGNIKITDKCMIMPKLYTVIHVKSGNESQEIHIDEGCNNFQFSNRREAKNVKKFIQFIRTLLNSKPEIKEVPPSNMLYM